MHYGTRCFTNSLRQNVSRLSPPMTLPSNSSDHPLRSASRRVVNTVRDKPSRPSNRVSITNLSFLRAELKRQPEIRPEVVARARMLAADPNYPSMATLRVVAQQILASPDLSEDNS